MAVETAVVLLANLRFVVLLSIVRKQLASPTTHWLAQESIPAACVVGPPTAAAATGMTAPAFAMVMDELEATLLRQTAAK